LGNGDRSINAFTTPVLVNSNLNSRIIDVDAGYEFVMFLRSNGKVYGFGRRDVFLYSFNGN
jgi:alpha-tubulin suppressor-like RCC1 family protein